MLTVVTRSESTPTAPDTAAVSAEAVTTGGLIDEIVRDGARRMLAAALEAEVAAYHRPQRGGRGARPAGRW